MILWEKIVEFLIERIGNNIVDCWRKSSSVDRAVSDLRSTLKQAHLLIERSECWRLPLLIDKSARDHPNKNSERIDKLLPKLKEAVYEAETVVHEFVYQGLKNEVEKRSSVNEIKRLLSNWMNGFPSTVKKALDELDQNCKEMKEICDKSNIPENPNEFSKTARPSTSTFPSTTNVYGRKKDLTNILKLMGVRRSGGTKRSRNVQVSNFDASGSSHGTNQEGNVSVLYIVGIGGVGKTTLAQMVCKDKHVKSYFDLIMWVCVSDNFDLMKLTNEIIQSATNKSCDLTNLDSLQKNLELALNSKRFLLVVDDVWSNEWQSLLGPMKGARNGSIVMVTTRSHECVRLSGTDIGSRGIANLKGLEEKIYWDLFKSQAFGSVATSDVDPELEVIGKEISKRLKGSPLAAKTIGRLLSTSMDVSHWMQIQDSPIWQQRQKESEILPALQLSYQYLPSRLKMCFSYCALYPKDFKFTKQELIKLWIMQGFISLPEQIKVCYREVYLKEATENFHELVQRCFFQKAADSRKDEYVIHDLMHDVCQTITKDECFCLDNGDWEKGIHNRNVRHLSIFQKGLTVMELDKLRKYKKLLSVRLAPRRCCGDINMVKKWCETVTNIRSLSFPESKLLNLPDNFGNLKHLQYLDMSFSNIEKLPDSFCELYNLLYLNMEGCSSIKSVPEGFSRLVNLRLLYWPTNRLILIGHIEKYARQIEMEDMNLHIGLQENIENLKHMNRLGGVLNVYKVENIPNKKAAEEAQLKNKPLISELNLHWSRNRERKDEHHDENVLEGLWPHRNLKGLRIYHYGGRTLPSWFQKEFLSHLTRICIESCKQLTNLQDCLNPNQFAMLEIIEINDCENLVSLPVESFEGFASLGKLQIRNCPKLICSNAMGLLLPPSINFLCFESCGGLEKLIPSCLQNLTSLDELTIKRCSGLVSIPTCLHNLKSLRRLTIDDCAELQSLEGLASLNRCYIWIQTCPQLAQTGGQDVKGKLPPELLSDLHSTACGSKRKRE